MKNTERRISDALGLRHRGSLRQYQIATQGRPLWPIEWRYYLFVVKHIFWYADSLQLRAVMGTASLGWAVALLTETEMFSRPAYSLMRVLPQWVWASAYAVHGFGAWWRIVERRARVHAAFWINFLGTVVWAAYTLAVNIAVERFAPTTVLECVMILLMIFATVNTGRNESRGTE